MRRRGTAHRNELSGPKKRLEGGQVVDTDIAGVRLGRSVIVLAGAQVFPSPNRDARLARNGCTVLACG